LDLNVPSPVNVWIVFAPEVVTVPPVAPWLPEYRMITIPEPPAPPLPFVDGALGPDPAPPPPPPVFVVPFVAVPEVAPLPPGEPPEPADFPIADEPPPPPPPAYVTGEPE
jgi:hypothetical protein